MARLWLVFVLCGGICVWKAPVNAQNQKIKFKKYGVADGLPEELVSCILQDEQGFLWITTQNGFVKYDGYEFRVFKASQSKEDPTQLLLRNINGKVIQGKDQRLWLGGMARGGVASFDPKTERFQNYLYNPDDPESQIPYPDCHMLQADSEGNIWFVNNKYAPFTRILCKLDPVTNEIKHFPYSIQGKMYDMLPSQFGQFACSPVDESVWVLDGANNVRRWLPAQDSFVIIHQSGSKLPGTEMNDTIHWIMSGKDKLLFTSKKGVYVWDPLSLQVVQAYHSVPGDANSLAPGVHMYTFEDHYGNYWVQNIQNAFTKIDPQTQRCTQYHYGKGKLKFPGAPENAIYFMIFISDAEELIFIFNHTVKRAFIRYDYQADTFTYYDNNFFYPDNGFPTDGIYFYPFKDRSNLLWIAHRGFLNKEAPKKEQIAHYEHQDDDPSSLPDTRIRNLFEDSKGRVWIGTYRGLARYVSSTDKFERIPILPASMDGRKINQIYEDSDGQIWIAGENGLFLFNEEIRSCKHIRYSFSGTFAIAGILEDTQGRLWVTAWKDGIYVLDKKSQKVIKSYHADPADSTALSSNDVGPIFQDSKGSMWFVDRLSPAPGFFRLDEREEKFTFYPGKAFGFIFEDAEQRIWTAADGGLFQYQEEKDTFEFFGDHINMQNIQSFGKGQDGFLWIGTYAGGGLVKINPKNHVYSVYGESHGLLQNDARCLYTNKNMAIDHFGHIYYPTTIGLSVFDPATESFSNYVEKDGFQASYSGYVSMTSSTGEVWIGSTNGLNRIEPEKLRRKDSIPPQVHITGVGILDSMYRIPDGDIFTQTVTYTEEISLTHDQNDLSFEFTGLHYLRPEANQYAWKLENYDEKWSKPSQERTAHYANLRPGTYNFRVKASNADGIWNEEGDTLRIVIAPPWWATWWARGSFLSILLGLAFLIYRYQLRRQLEHAEALRLKELDTVKSRLYTNITHEFRTPLTVIRGMARKISTEPEIAEKMILRNSNNLLRLVNQMLDLSKLESGKLAVNMIQGNVISYLRYLTESFQSFAASKNINLVFYTETEKTIMDYDEEKLQHIVTNLLSNAIKFSYENSKIVLHASLRRQGELEQLIIKVKDQGVGIPPEVLPYIFDRFYQADNSSTRKGEGTGIGLTFTRELVNLLGGKMEVESEVGQGSTFVVSLPVSRKAEVKAGAQPVLSPEVIPTASSISSSQQASGQENFPLALIIEDNPDVTFYIQSCLEAQYQVITAENGKIGIEKALEHSPDLIISDVMMPEKDGFELCHTLKRDERTSHIPIILLTARADVESRIAGLQEGADAYLAKPFEKEELLVRMAQMIRLRKTLQDRYRGRDFSSLPAVAETNAYKREDSFIRKVNLLIEEQLADPEFSIDKLARDLGMSRSQLFRKIKALTGKSIMLFVRSYRLGRARQLLISTDLSVSEIAYEVGFKTPSHFSASFLEEFGTQPGTIRAEKS